MRKLLKWTFLLGLAAVGTLVAIQFDPVRDALKKLGLPL